MTLAIAWWGAGFVCAFVAGWLGYKRGERRGRLHGFADGLCHGVKMTVRAFGEADAIVVVDGEAPYACAGTERKPN